MVVLKLQNMHPGLRTHFAFSKSPESLWELCTESAATELAGRQSSEAGTLGA
jgi:hypothetical protein